jgi:NNP family nitrate/nitrite transporter-like MFS transporter
MPQPQHPGAYRTLVASTLAFMVCFAVWMMFGVVGIPLKADLGLNNTEFGLLSSTPTRWPSSSAPDPI